jgi:hypothetical protein
MPTSTTFTAPLPRSEWGSGDSCMSCNFAQSFRICSESVSGAYGVGLSGILSQKLSKGWSSDRPFFCVVRGDSRSFPRSGGSSSSSTHHRCETQKDPESLEVAPGCFFARDLTRSGNLLAPSHMQLRQLARASETPKKRRPSDGLHTTQSHPIFSHLQQIVSKVIRIGPFRHPLPKTFHRAGLRIGPFFCPFSRQALPWLAVGAALS